MGCRCLDFESNVSAEGRFREEPIRKKLRTFNVGRLKDVGSLDFVGLNNGCYIHCLCMGAHLFVKNILEVLLLIDKMCPAPDIYGLS
ncbi:unnamed protein product [Haemonchus placei]|uniref:Ovule protein n=1 Tax=Haemonchus placei TaxID=6290 RepID=A0A0N4W3G9_HAEPC|nr:unnamed protein product [Haemonchus placei]